MFYDGPNQVSKLIKFIKETTDFDWVQPEEEENE